jgi:hypothetical protein
LVIYDTDLYQWEIENVFPGHCKCGEGCVVKQWYGHTTKLEPFLLELKISSPSAAAAAAAAAAEYKPLQACAVYMGFSFPILKIKN